MYKSIKYLLICCLCAINFITTIACYNIVQAERYDLKWNISFVYKVLPVLVVHDPKSEILVKKGMVGCQIGPIIVVGDNYGDEDNTVRHELEHVKQGYRGLFIFSILRYNYDKKYKILAEYDAYKAETNNFRDDVITEILYDDAYKLSMTREEIYKTIKDYR